MKRLLIFTILLIVFAAVSAANAITLSPVVQTPNGPVQGIDSEYYQGIYSFKGIPFAQPPVGNLRFADPVPASSWTNTLNATKFSPGCMNPCTAELPHFPGFPLPKIMCPEKVSEDCLYLNVYTPTLDPNANLPVLFWIYGGDFTAGSASVDLYDFSDFCKNQNIVGVAANYRVGAFGGLYNGRLRGNFHIKDQQTALKWVNSAIQNFGGDPDNVVINGQSAGGTSTWVHTISPGSWPYFSKAIPMSAPLGIPLLSTTDAQSLGDLVAKNVGCPAGGSDLAIECLRNVPAQVMLVNGSGTNYPVGGKTGVEMFMRWTAVVDGDTVPLEIATAYVNNRWAHKPMMPTTVANESVEFVQGFGTVKPNDLGVLLSIFMRNITIGVGAVEHYWPGGVPQVPDALPLLEPLVTDYLFQCPTKYFGQAAVKQNPNVPFYEYYFSLSYASWLNWTYVEKGNMPFCAGVTCHADDIPLIFWPWKIARAMNAAPPTPPTQEEDYLHLQMQTAWANFARTSNPNDASGNPLLKNEKLKHLAQPMLGAFRRIGSSTSSRFNNATFPFFPRFDEQDIKMNFSIPATLIQNYRTYYCDFWDVYTKNAEGIPYRIS